MTLTIKSFTRTLILAASGIAATLYLIAACLGCVGLI